MDPLLMNIIWNPMFTILAAIILSVYIKVTYLAYTSRKRIQVNSVPGYSVQSGTDRSQSKTTRSLLMVLGIFLSTHTVWMIIYYITLDIYSDVIELVQTLIDWLWNVNILSTSGSYCSTLSNVLPKAKLSLLVLSIIRLTVDLVTSDVLT